MKLSLSAALLSAFLLFSSAGTLQAQTRMGPNGEHREIRGNVYYEELGKPADHVFVNLLTESGSNLATATTDPSGSFQFWDLVPETYQISVRQEGYSPVTLTLNLVDGPEYNAVIVLHKQIEFQNAPPGSTVSAHRLSMPQKVQQEFNDGLECLYQRKKPKDAIADFEKAIKAAPGFYEADEAMGWAYSLLGEPSNAEKAFNASVKASDDKYAPAEVGLGATLLDVQQVSEAQKSLKRALDLDPKSWRAHYEMGRAMLMSGNTPDALNHAEEAAKLNPNAPAVYRLLAVIHIKLNDAPALLADLNSYIRLDPNSPAGIRAKQIRDQVAKVVQASGTAAKKVAAPQK